MLLFRLSQGPSDCQALSREEQQPRLLQPGNHSLLYHCVPHLGHHSTQALFIRQASPTCSLHKMTSKTFSFMSLTLLKVARTSATSNPLNITKHYRTQASLTQVSLKRARMCSSRAKGIKRTMWVTLAALSTMWTRRCTRRKSFMHAPTRRVDILVAL